MNRRLRGILKLMGWSIGGFVLLLTAFAGLLAFPGFMFAHEVAFANLSAYSDDDRSEALAPVLQEIHARITQSTIDAPATTHRIFFGNDKPLFGFLQNARARLVQATIGQTPSATYNASWPPQVSHVVTFRMPDFDRGKLVSESWPKTQDTAYLLTHEITHSLVLERLGMRRAAALPLWKAEGYPDYVAATVIRHAASYSLRDSMTRLMHADLASMRTATGDIQPLDYRCIGQSYVTIETGDFWNTCYYLSRLLVEYQIDVKGLTFDELMAPAVNDVDSWRELRAAYEAGRL